MADLGAIGTSSEGGITQMVSNPLARINGLTGSASQPGPNPQPFPGGGLIIPTMTGGTRG